ncbi:MAG TPA: single-stranded DNA-binding protein [Saprospiraceae bacterium]|nr:single-stranded DNA-binding protein [Saprospiraceae bacterium]HND88021.1 single-stranded DNA-binding protein [Saprospiraceae bacterium]
MINKVTLIGHLGADPEIRTLENGTSVGRFSLATNENYKDREGNWQTMTDWHNIVVWRDLADRAKNMLKKGSTVYVEGKISYRKYTDKDGVEKNLTDIVANTFRLLDKREGSGGYDSRFPSAEPPTRANASDAASMTPSSQDTPPPPAEGDDLPF